MTPYPFCRLEVVDTVCPPPFPPLLLLTPSLQLHPPAAVSPAQRTLYFPGAERHDANDEGYESDENSVAEEVVSEDGDHRTAHTDLEQRALTAFEEMVAAGRWENKNYSPVTPRVRDHEHERYHDPPATAFGPMAPPSISPNQVLRSNWLQLKLPKTFSALPPAAVRDEAWHPFSEVRAISDMPRAWQDELQRTCGIIGGVEKIAWTRYTLRDGKYRWVGRVETYVAANSPPQEWGLIKFPLSKDKRDPLIMMDSLWGYPGTLVGYLPGSAIKLSALHHRLSSLNDRLRFHITKANASPQAEPEHRNSKAWKITATHEDQAFMENAIDAILARFGKSEGLFSGAMSTICNKPQTAWKVDQQVRLANAQTQLEQGRDEVGMRVFLNLPMLPTLRVAHQIAPRNAYALTLVASGPSLYFTLPSPPEARRYIQDTQKKPICLQNEGQEYSVEAFMARPSRTTQAFIASVQDKATELYAQTAQQQAAARLDAMVANMVPTQATYVPPPLPASIPPPAVLSVEEQHLARTFAWEAENTVAPNLRRPHAQRQQKPTRYLQIGRAHV